MAEGFQKITTSRSALACVAGTILALAAWQGIVFYGVSFFRKRFLVLGSAVGGVALQWFDWSVLGLSLGLLGIGAAVIYALLAVDPTQTGRTATAQAGRKGG